MGKAKRVKWEPSPHYVHTFHGAALLFLVLHLVCACVSVCCGYGYGCMAVICVCIAFFSTFIIFTFFFSAFCFLLTPLQLNIWLLNIIGCIICCLIVEDTRKFACTYTTRYRRVRIDKVHLYDCVRLLWMNDNSRFICTHALNFLAAVYLQLVREEKQSPSML